MSLKDEAMKILNEGIKKSDADDFDGAIKDFHEIAEVLDCVANAIIQRGRCNWEMKRWDIAHPDFKVALRIAPDSPDINWTSALMSLQLNNFEEGWKGNERRWESTRFDSPRMKTNRPQWTLGSDAKEVCAWSEQGVGDQILYGAFLPELRKHVDVLTVMMDARLIPLFERSMPDITFIPQNYRVKGIDAQIPFASIASQFIKEMTDIPKYVKPCYLKPDESLVTVIRKHLDKKEGEIIVGLSWRSGAPRIGNHKTVDLDSLVPLFEIPGVRMINLQYGDTTEELKKFEEKYGHKVETINFIKNTHDIDGFAALVGACDIVVTCSNVTTHVAGAIGKDTLLLDSNKLWYWNNRSGRNSFWYPSVMVYPRENVIAPWAPQVKDVVSQFKFKTGLTPPPTFVFFHYGDATKMTQRMVDSINQYNPGAEIIMCSDEATPEIRGITRRVNFEFDREKPMEARLMVFAKLFLNKPAMYIDNDMLFLDYIDVEEILGHKEIVMCRRSFDKHLSFNTKLHGLDFSEHAGKTIDQVYPYLACATITRNFEPWGSMYGALLALMDEKYRRWYGDQEALRFAAMALTKLEMGEIEEREYACLPEYANQINRPRILHFKGNRKDQVK